MVKGGENIKNPKKIIKLPIDKKKLMLYNINNYNKKWRGKVSMRKIKINGKEWTVVIRPLSLKPVEKTGVFDMESFATQLAGFMPKVDTHTEYGEINPTQWGEEIL